MAFHDREYEVYVVLGGPDQPRSRGFNRPGGNISAVLDPLVQAARDRPAVRSSQLGPKPGSSKLRSISFGRIGWNDRGARKWCHGRDGQLVSGDRAYFLATDAWAPSWTACEREREAPDVFFSITNVSLRPGDTAKFSSTCVLAVASNLSPDSAGQARESADAIASTLQAVVRGYCVRPWGRSTDGGVSFYDAINDLADPRAFSSLAACMRRKLPFRGLRGIGFRASWASQVERSSRGRAARSRRPAQAPARSLGQHAYEAAHEVRVREESLP